MKYSIYRCCLLLVVLVMSLNGATAQDKTNIVEYGDFSKKKEYKSFPEGWSLPGSVYSDYKNNKSLCRPGSKDSFCLLFQPQNNVVLGSNLYGNQNILKVEPGAEYEVTIWAKDHSEDSSGSNRFEVEFDWYAESEPNYEHVPIRRGVKVKSFSVSLDWKSYTAQVKVPDGIHSAALKVRFKSYGSMIYMDDISMVKTKKGETGGVPKPSSIKINPSQHEIEMSWSAVSDKTVRWKYQLEGGKEVDLGIQTNLVLERLNAHTTYKISIWGEKNGKQSQKEVKQITTAPFKYAENDPQRVPYLRSVNAAGTCWKHLKTYFNELYDLNATITYKQNGKIIVPDENGVLNLEWKPTVSEFLDKTTLEVTIDEGNDKKWTLTYYLSVSKDPVNY